MKKNRFTIYLDATALALSTVAVTDAADLDAAVLKGAADYGHLGADYPLFRQYFQDRRQAFLNLQKQPAPSAMPVLVAKAPVPGPAAAPIVPPEPVKTEVAADKNVRALEAPAAPAEEKAAPAKETP